MGFLIRTIFWFSLVLLILPLGGGSTDEGRQDVSPFQAFFAMREAVGDLTAICERKPGVCEVGSAAFHTIKARAGESARIAYENSRWAFRRTGPLDPDRQRSRP